MWKQRLGAGVWFAQSHKARQWESWDLNLGLADPNPGLLLLKIIAASWEVKSSSSAQFSRVVSCFVFVCFHKTKCLYWTPVVEASSAHTGLELRG